MAAGWKSTEKQKVAKNCQLHFVDERKGTTALAGRSPVRYEIYPDLLPPRFLQSYYNRKQIFAFGNYHLLSKD